MRFVRKGAGELTVPLHEAEGCSELVLDGLGCCLLIWHF